MKGAGGNEQEIGRGVESGVHYHHVFSMLLGLCGLWCCNVRFVDVFRVFSRVRVIGIVRVRVSFLVRELVMYMDI